MDFTRLSVKLGAFRRRSRPRLEGRLLRLQRLYRLGSRSRRWFLGLSSRRCLRGRVDRCPRGRRRGRVGYAYGIDIILGIYRESRQRGVPRRCARSIVGQRFGDSVGYHCVRATVSCNCNQLLPNPRSLSRTMRRKVKFSSEVNGRNER